MRSETPVVRRRDREPSIHRGSAARLLWFCVLLLFHLPLPSHGDTRSSNVDAPPPAEFLGYEIGERFTHHHRIVDYLRALGDRSDRAALVTYGETVEGRPLTYLAITSPQNHARLDRIFATSRALGTTDGAPTADQPAIVWLAYGVHGNESSSAEAAMEVAWTLVAKEGELLDDVVVIIDPLVNPDGRERYVQFYESRVGAEADPHPDTMEHREPWPGGRTNHYLFDLNRDWAWLTQAETRHRLAAYREIEPQIYVDVHEMQPSSTYYFAPPADPLLPLFADGAFDDSIFDDLVLLGDANARAFDRRGWTYFVREIFDFFYPGYGDTYPTLRGGLGMTYEMAGGGRAGTIYRRDDGSLLTLRERVARHALATLETVRTAATHRARLLRGFTERRGSAGEARTWLWSARQPEARALAALLERHGLDVRRLGQARELRVRPHLASDDEPRDVERELDAGTFLVDTRGPLGSLARALLDRHHELGDDFVERQRRRLARGQGEQIFDVTAWSLPLAYGVETWVRDGVVDAMDATVDDSAEDFDPSPPRETSPSLTDAPLDDGEASRVGWLIPPQGLRGYRLAAGLLRAGVRLRVAAASTTPETAMSRPGESLEADESTRGTLLVAREDQTLADLAAVIRRLAAETGAVVDPVQSSWNDHLRSLGSNAFRRVTPPTVGLVGGDGVSATSHGSLWHLFDRQLAFPLRRLERSDVLEGRVNLEDVDVLILPDGRWGDVGMEARQRLDEWLRAGGQLLLVEDAWELARDAEWTEIEERNGVSAGPAGPAGPAGTSQAGSIAEEPEPSSGSTPRYESFSAESLSTERLSVPGAFVATEVQAGHPLALGLPAPPPILLRGDRFFAPSGDPRIDLLRVVEESPVVSGLLWSELEPVVAGSLLVAAESVGEGRVVTFAQDPSFRGFTRGAMPLLLGAAFYGPSI